MKYCLLTTKKNKPYGGLDVKAKFYFRTEENADKFVHTLRQHLCHVEFDKSFEDICPDIYKRYLDEDPVKFAENNLHWGWTFDEYYGDDKLTDEENSFVQHIMNIATR